MSKFHAKEYLALINAPQIKTADLAYLRILQEHHIYHIPFENLDLHRGIPIQFDVDHLFEKIVLRQRGGFCYELNGLFYALLQELGYDCWRISARVYDVPRKYSPRYDHMAVVVRLTQGLFLVDVGFGEFSLHPIRLAEGTTTNDGRSKYLVDRYYQYYRINSWKEGNWIPEYIFRLTPQPWHAFHERSLYHQTNPSSHFQKGPMITKLKKEGRITLTKRKLKFLGKEEPVAHMEHFAQLLYRHFNLHWKAL